MGIANVCLGLSYTELFIGYNKKGKVSHFQGCKLVSKEKKGIGAVVSGTDDLKVVFETVCR